MRRLASLIAVGLVGLVPAVPASAGGSAGGPVVLMGIDAEDGGPGGHGPITVYESVVSDILGNVTNGGTGILVIGGGKSLGKGPAGGTCDDVTPFWDTIGTDLSVPITYVNTAAAIAAADFSGFAMLAVISDENQTGCGGLTLDENDALAGRSADVSDFVNGGGGLSGFSSDFDAGAGPYAYLGGLGAFTILTELSYEDIAPTAAGTAIGITDDLDICCWHDVFTTFPSFLSVLATHDQSGDPEFGEAAALGGAQVVIGGGATVRGHAHRDVPGNEEVRDIHIVIPPTSSAGSSPAGGPGEPLNDNPIRYFDFRPSFGTMRCHGGRADSLTILAENKVRIDGTIACLFQKTSAARFSLTVTNLGPPPDRFRMQLFNAGGVEIYDLTRLTTPGLGNLVVVVT